MVGSRIHVVRARPISFTAAVLAAGNSTRMGVDKAFLPVGNELLIERQLRCLRETEPAELLISGRTEVDYSRFGLRVIHDGQSDCGPLAGVAALLEASFCSMLLVLAVDMPAMRFEVLQNILAQCSENVGCVPLDVHGFQPLAAVYPRVAFALAEQQLAAGRYSMEAFVNKAVAASMVRTLTIDAPDCEAFANWNRPDDWRPASS